MNEKQSEKQLEFWNKEASFIEEDTKPHEIVNSQNEIKPLRTAYIVNLIVSKFRWSHPTFTSIHPSEVSFTIKDHWYVIQSFLGVEDSSNTFIVREMISGNKQITKFSEWLEQLLKHPPSEGEFEE